MAKWINWVPQLSRVDWKDVLPLLNVWKSTSYKTESISMACNEQSEEQLTAPERFLAVSLCGPVLAEEQIFLCAQRQEESGWTCICVTHLHGEKLEADLLNCRCTNSSHIPSVPTCPQQCSCCLKFMRTKCIREQFLCRRRQTSAIYSYKYKSAFNWAQRDSLLLQEKITYWYYRTLWT